MGPYEASDGRHQLRADNGQVVAPRRRCPSMPSDRSIQARPLNNNSAWSQTMNLRRSCLLSLASLFFLALPPTAHAQGNATRGAMLYATTYTCTGCHNHPIPPDPKMKLGSTPQGIINAINNPATGMASFYGATLANNPTDLADLAAYIALSTEAPPTSPDLNQHGLTGSWYETTTGGQGIEVEI